MALPESEIRELAVSLGLSGISPGQSKSQLVELITQQQQRAEASNSRRQAMPRRSLSQTSVRAASLSAQRPGGRETERNESRRNNLNSQSLGAERGSRSSHPTGSVTPSSHVRMQPMQPQPPALEARQSAHGRPPRGKAPPMQRPSGRAMTTSPRSNLASQSLLSPPTSGISAGHPPAPRACSERRHRTQPSAEPRRPVAKSSASPSRPQRPRLGVAGSALRGIGQMVVEERSMEPTESRLRQA